MGYYYYYDSSYILVLIGAVITLWASMLVQNRFNKYSKIGSATGITGAEAARRILYYEGITDVTIEHVSGSMTDHYDPRSKVLRLSDTVYGSTSVAALGVAAHECGHAAQHAHGYLPLSFRSALAPVAGIGSRLGLPILIVGSILGSFDVLVPLGIWIFALSVLFHIVTLPVELNASSRALKLLDKANLLNRSEISGCRKVLGAAAMTYVAAAAASLLQLLRLVLIFGGRRRD